jgi:hypothetical protein
LTPHSFFLWGHVKNAVYGRTGQVANLDELRQRITAAVEAATAEMLKCEWAEIGYRLGICRGTKETEVDIC